MATGNQIRHYREKLKLTLEELSAISGVEIGTISALENRDSERSKYFDAIAKAFGLTIEQLADENKDWLDSVEREESNLEDAPQLRPFRNVPIVGTVQGGDDGYLVDLEYPVGHGDGSIRYPAKDENSYALRVRGDSMRPRIKNGEFIVVEPNHPPQPGDDVVVCLSDGRRMVKELLYTRDGEVTLGSINNGHGNITVASEKIEKMHYVAAIIPRGAFYKP
ncbi:MAG: XRE family transcriptional regulator [Betaproteobacteria bacterium]|nr:XRE family transcriptional regulator [Betaproteobacteria bacterium]